MVTFNGEESRHTSNLIDPDHRIAEESEVDLDSYSKDILVGGMEVDQPTWDNLPYSQDYKVNMQHIARPTDWVDVNVGNIVLLNKDNMLSIKDTDSSAFNITFYNKIPHRIVGFEGDIHVSDAHNILDHSITLSPMDEDRNIKVVYESEQIEDGEIIQEKRTIKTEDQKEEIADCSVGPCLVSDKLVSQWVDFDTDLLANLI